MDLGIRPAAETDLPALTEIYNHYVLGSPATFDLQPLAVDQRREWFAHHATTGRHRLLVAVQGPRVLGYATSSRWRPKLAYDTTVETTIYLHPEAGGRGIGKLLYMQLLDELEGEDVHRAVAGIVPPNEPSMRLHRTMGFHEVGRFTEVGWKFGRYWDVIWLEKVLGAKTE